MRKRISNSPNRQLWNFSLTAASLLFFTALAIAIIFFVVHQQRVMQLSARSELISNIIVEKSIKHFDSPLKQLSETSRAMMELNDFNSVLLINASGEKIFEYGPPLAPQEFNTSFTQSTRWKQDSQLYLSTKMSSISNEPLWFISTIDLTYASLINLQFLFFSLLILFGILAFSVVFYRKLNRDIFTPLESLNEILSKQNKIRDMSPVILRQPGVLEELIQQTNESFSIQIEKEMDFKKNMDSATQELRESLETVEIHNIDLDMARKNALELNKLKSEFLKKTSQDLRTSLSGILGFSELLRKTILSKEQNDYVSTIEDTTKGILTIVGDIHDFSRLESGTLHVDKKSVDLRRTIEETLTLQAPIAQEREVTLYSSIEQDVPASVLGDSMRLQQVLSNLVSIAIKFDQCSYIELCLQKTNQTSNDITLKANIKTDGICPFELQHWQPDTEESSSTDAFYTGTDMGLSIAKGIAHHMGGNIEFENTEDTRSFLLYIKLPHDNKAPVPTKSIDSTYKIHALVYSNNDIGYREVTSRLYELGIHNQRAKTFSEILTIAQHLKDESQKHARYLPIAVIEAQTSQQTLDKILLAQTLKTLNDDFNIPAVVVAPTGQFEQLQKILSGTDISITQHPIITSRFRKSILDQLGIVRLTQDHSGLPPSAIQNSMRVLLVDDNPANLKLATALLADFNVDIRTASTGCDAVRLFNEHSFDLVFMDIQLPDFDGYEATKKMRALEQTQQHNQRTPIVALTAHDVVEEKINLLLAGMDDLIGKPLTKKDIGKIIDRWVSSSKKGQTRLQTEPSSQKPKSKKLEDGTHDNIKIETSPLEESDSSPVNISQSLSLAKDDPSLANDMLSMLIESLEEEQNLIQQAIKDSNFDTLYEHIHKLHGACCYCGVPSLKNITKVLDTQLKNKVTDNLENNLVELYRSIEELNTWAESHDLKALFDLPT